MKIAITSQNRREITAHAGRCRKFWIYDIDDSQEPAIKDKQLLELPQEQSLHELAHSGIQGPHPIDSVNVFITGSMGGGVRQKLAIKGIRGITTKETDPDKAVAAFLAGSLVEQPQEEDCNCSGHDHDHDHDHGHQHGHQQAGSAIHVDFVTDTKN